jgi:hypothetical protein
MINPDQSTMDDALRGSTLLPPVYLLTIPDSSLSLILSPVDRTIHHMCCMNELTVFYLNFSDSVALCIYFVSIAFVVYFQKRQRLQLDLASPEPRFL